jgi:hypothetical protein
MRANPLLSPFVLSEVEARSFLVTAASFDFAQDERPMESS